MDKGYHDSIQKRRIEQKTKKFRNQMKVRAQVEGTISEAVRFHGLRYKKYKGVLGDKLQFYLTGAAINLNKVDKGNKSSIECLLGRITNKIIIFVNVN